MKNPSDMTDRELDAAVAVEVMGWKLEDRKACGWGDGPPVYSTNDRTNPTFQDPRFSDDVSHDYAVLVHVREKWNGPQQCTFGENLDEMWAKRARGDSYVPENAAYYEPGDYARAALAAVRQEKKSATDASGALERSKQ